MYFIFNNMSDLKPSPYQSWLDSLQASGYRLTGPRRTLVEIIASSQRALSPLDIFEQGRAECAGLGLVTVYRTLEKLEELGLIQRVHQPDGCHRYLPASQGHEHLLLCTDCGRAFYFTGDDLGDLITDIARRSRFQINDHWLQLFGLCQACQEKLAA